MKTFRKILSVITVACMLFSGLPMTVYAQADVEVDTSTKAGTVYVYANGRHIRVMPDGIYDLYTGELLTKIASSTINGGIFGGAKDGNVTSTKVVVANGASPAKVWGGCWDGDVTGSSEVIIEDGGSVGTLYGGSNTSGTVGSTYVEVNKNKGSVTTLFAGGNKASTSGNIKLVLNNATVAGLGGGSNVGGVNSGDIDIKINNSAITGNFYGGGGSGSSVKGSVTIRIDGSTTIATDKDKVFQPMCRSTTTTGGTRVDGDAYVYIPRTFTEQQINGIEKNSGIFIFYNDGEQIFGPPAVSSDIINKNIFANGASVTVKTYAADGNTYLYNEAGTKQLLKFPIDDYKIYGGSSTLSVENSYITLESGRVAEICGSGLNGSVTGTSYIKVSKGATVTGNVYSESGVGKSGSSVIWVPENFGSKIRPSENARVFIGATEIANTNITVSKEVYKKDNFIFANGIPIVIKKDTKDNRTYIYDSTGATKLLSTEVNGMEIYGGSYSGVVDSTNVTMESGTVTRIYGGGYTACVKGIAMVTVTGGDITEVIYGGSYDGDVGGTQINVSGPYVAKAINGGSRNGCVLGSTSVSLRNNSAKGLYAGTGGEGRGVFFPASDVLGNVSLTVEGGMAESIYGGCKSGLVYGNSTINIIGDVKLKKLLSPKGLGGVNGTSQINTPEGFTYPADILPKEQYKSHNPEVLSTSGDSGKLVFRFVDIPEPSGKYVISRPGEAYFITFPNGENMLVDSGANTASSQKAVTDFLDGLGVTKINYLVITHYHADHDGYAAYILNKYNVDTLYTTGFNVPQTTDYSIGIKNWITANPDKVKYLWRNDKFNIGDVCFEVLNPLNGDSIKSKMNGDPSTDDYNNNSIVMKVTYGVNSAILAGDLYVAAENELLAAYSNDPGKLNADLIKVPHHGDTTSSDPEFVNAVSPDIAVFTHFCDTAIVSGRYREAGARTFITGVDGIIRLSYDGINKTPEIMTEYYTPEPSAISLTGGEDMIYVDSTKTTVADYTYSVTDQYGKPLENATVAVTITDDNGNLINDPAITFENNTLTVKGKPQAAYIVVNYICSGIKASRRTVFADTPLLDINPDKVSIRYGNPVFSLMLTGDNYTEDIVPELVKGELASTMNSYLYKTGMSEGTKLSLNLDKTTGKFRAVKSVNGAEAILTSSDAGDYTAYISFPELNLQGAFKLSILNITGVPSKKNTDVIVPPNPETPVPTDTKPGNTPKPSESKEFSDIKNHWAESYIQKLADKGIINGKDNNSFDPDGKITRAEFTAIIARAFNLPAGSKGAFADVSADSWYAGYINAACNAGIINGNGNGSFAPEELITREEMAVIACNAYNYVSGVKVTAKTEAVFTDKDSISQWASDSVAYLYELGLIKGSDGSFAPKSDMTRAEGVTIIYNIMVKLGRL